MDKLDRTAFDKIIQKVQLLRNKGSSYFFSSLSSSIDEPTEMKERRINKPTVAELTIPATVKQSVQLAWSGENQNSSISNNDSDLK